MVVDPILAGLSSLDYPACVVGQSSAIDSTCNGPIRKYLLHDILLSAHTPVVVDSIHLGVLGGLAGTGLAVLALDLGGASVPVGVPLSQVGLAGRISNIVPLDPPEGREWLTLNITRHVPPCIRNPSHRRTAAPGTRSPGPARQPCV